MIPKESLGRSVQSLGHGETIDEGFGHLRDLGRIVPEIVESQSSKILMIGSHRDGSPTRVSTTLLGGLGLLRLLELRGTGANCLFTSSHTLARDRSAGGS